ncbi:TetR/AcrR family transcriptional regulator [Streptomyces kanamyceticus]|uniref:TetR family transcriptional regulator n=1 Tax=Streptomyces kanamyceticus TaxID=1967 RepID=A0A5J6GMX4_STRKN|nr:TetR family transcriptional regulator [Streptomyces kanamyceticus]QEU95734.1 TetR family transcriptional regulator [Streptomyces kanamyceticus]
MKLEPDDGAPGLRARKKQLTRDALIQSAIELFDTQGYEKTTVDEIVSTVNVSARTFFRYFAGKEDVALALVTEIDERVLVALSERPAQEPPLEALRGAVRETWTQVREQTERVSGVNTLARILHLVETAPGLSAAHTRRAMVFEERLAREIARREAVEFPTDPRPKLVVAVFSSVTRVASQCWGLEEEADLDTIARTIEEHFDLLLPTLQGPWPG